MKEEMSSSLQSIIINDTSKNILLEIYKKREDSSDIKRNLKFTVWTHGYKIFLYILFSWIFLWIFHVSIENPLESRETRERIEFDRFNIPLFNLSHVPIECDKCFHIMSDSYKNLMEQCAWLITLTLSADIKSVKKACFREAGFDKW